MIQPDHSDHSATIVVGYVRRSSEMQRDNYSIDAQKRAIRDACKLRGLPEPIFKEEEQAEDKTGGLALREEICGQQERNQPLQQRPSP